MQRAPSLLRKVYSGFNVGRILAGSLQPKLLRLAHPLPKESSPERQEPTLRMAERFHVKPCHLLSAAPYTIRNRTDATAIIRRHSPRGGVLRRAAYEPTCSRPEHRPCVACRRPSQVCWFRKAPSHVSRETKAHPFHTRLDGRSASYVLVDIEVGAPPTAVLTSDEVYSSSRDVPGANAPTIRARSSSPANSIVIRPFFAPRVTLTRVSKASERRVESAGRGVLRARSTFG